MNSKAIRKQLLAAVAMVLVAAVALGSSTYAWFANNNRVTATTMSVTAQSNAAYLYINNSGTAAGGGTSVAALKHAGADQIYPATYVATASTLGSTSTEADKWYTANNKNENNATDAIINVKEVAEGEAAYMHTYKVWLTLSQDSEAFSKKINITFNKSSGDDALYALVVINGEKIVLNSASQSATTARVVPLSSETAVTVVVYAYMDGNSTNVNSDYIKTNTLSGAFTLDFAVAETN